MAQARILIVEDQILISTNIRLLLKFNNYDVSGIASNAEDALQMIEKDQPDLILMDISLPGKLDGIEATKIIRSRWNIPVIYLTARKDAQTLERAKETDAYGYLTKDIELKEQLPIVVEFSLYRCKTEKEKKIAQEKISASQEIFSGIARTAQDAIIILENDSTVSYWNDAAEVIFGYSKDDAIGNSITDLIAPLAYTDIYERGFLEYKDTGIGGFAGKFIELEASRKDGEILSIDLSLATMQIKGQWCACATIRDITKRKTAEEEISRLVEELQISKDMIEQNANDVIYLNSKLSESEELLRELNASKDKFFSIIAHDLKGPFTGLLGYSEILSKDVDNLSKQEISEFAHELYDAAKHLFKLLENLLQWTRIQRGMIECAPTNINLNKLVSLNMDLVNFNALQKSITLDNQVSTDLIVYSDLNMANTVFRNLLSNAVKFTASKGRIEVSAVMQDENFIEVTVKDNGIGISNENKKKMFKIDEHITTVGTANEKGSGLGLILCKDLVEKNGGTIRVESDLGEGTSFIFTLPVGNSTDEIMDLD